jgi:hypothetical protein
MAGVFGRVGTVTEWVMCSIRHTGAPCTANLVAQPTDEQHGRG